MIPRNDGVELTETIQIRRMPSLTDRLDLEKGKIQGTADGQEAMKQAIYKILHTKRYWKGNSLLDKISEECLPEFDWAFVT